MPISLINGFKKLRDSLMGNGKKNDEPVNDTLKKIQEMYKDSNNMSALGYVWYQKIVNYCDFESLEAYNPFKSFESNSYVSWKDYHREKRDCELFGKVIVDKIIHGVDDDTCYWSFIKVMADGGWEVWGLGERYPRTKDNSIEYLKTVPSIVVKNYQDNEMPNHVNDFLVADKKLRAGLIRSLHETVQNLLN